MTPATRTRLPNRRSALVSTLRHMSADYEVTVGLHPTGEPAEIFIDANKPGSQVAQLAQDVAVLISLALQFGVPLETMRAAMARDHLGQPGSIAGAALDHLFGTAAAP